MLDRLIAVGFLAIAVWQFYATYKGWRKLKAQADQGTSGFAPLGFWFSAVFGGLMLILGLMILFGVM